MVSHSQRLGRLVTTARFHEQSHFGDGRVRFERRHGEAVVQFRYLRERENYSSISDIERLTLTPSDGGLAKGSDDGASGIGSLIGTPTAAANARYADPKGIPN